MEFENILVAKEDAAFVLTINRPAKRNSLSVATVDEISRAVQAADKDPEVRGIIISGGIDFFSSGADLNEALAVESADDADAFFGGANRLCEQLEGTSKPVIAAIEGFCFTGALEISLACDIRIGGRGSTYAITSSRIGTLAGFGGTQRLPRLIGPANAIEMLFLAEPLAAEDAHRIGLINRLVVKGAALAEAKAMVAVFVERGPLSLAYAKRAIRHGLEMDIRSAVAFEFSLVSQMYRSEDKREGISAFLEKRRPNFAGR